MPGNKRSGQAFKKATVQIRKDKAEAKRVFNSPTPEHEHAIRRAQNDLHWKKKSKQKDFGPHHP